MGLVQEAISNLGLFKVAKSAITVVNQEDPVDKYWVIDRHPQPNMSMYCIYTKHGWVVFFKEYVSNDHVFPSIFGKLYLLMDRDHFTEAQLNGMSLCALDNLLESL